MKIKLLVGYNSNRSRKIAMKLLQSQHCSQSLDLGKSGLYTSYLLYYYMWGQGHVILDLYKTIAP